MRTYTHGEFTFEVRDCGPADGDPVVLLHGFPQYSGAWRDVTTVLNEAGLRTLAPDLRGYSPRARPASIAAYRLEVIAGDVLALLDAAGLDSAHLVGHDWGGALAWQLAATHPQRLRTATILSTPHPAALRWAMTHSTQIARSWYVGAVQIPRLPERLLAAGLRREGLSSLGLPTQYADEYATRLTHPGALRVPLNWYRALRTRPPAVTGPVSVPTTYMWGNQDRYLGRAAARRTARHCLGDYEFVEVAGDHWLPEKQPGLVAQAVQRRIKQFAG